MFTHLVEFIGEDNICLGSDYPFPLGEHKPGKLIEKMDLGKKVARKLLYRNALNWLGLNEKFLSEY
jgi:aminocarboxymuconate-semialdehyde decarboxylase